jgi:coenzyme F420-0:L-glutamate ligase/coenzyme F420-1:gamma-L-glutamate ligase
VTLTIHPLRGIPEVEVGADLGGLLLASLDSGGLSLIDGDVVAITHKIVSKAEGAIREIDPEHEDAEYRRIVLDEAAEVIRVRGDLIIAKTAHGFICANAGVDRSNALPGTVVLLPRDPDRSAHRIRVALEKATGARIAVVVSDTFGRPWRRGLTDVAIGISGMEAVLDLKGTTDTTGRELNVTEVALVDELAAAADLVMGKAASIPAALIRGLAWQPGDGRATDLIRPAIEDMFR